MAATTTTTTAPYYKNYMPAQANFSHCARPVLVDVLVFIEYGTLALLTRFSISVGDISRFIKHK